MTLFAARYSVAVDNAPQTPMTDKVGDIAHLFTGAIGRTCCYKTGGYGDDPKCECRDLAETVIENFEKIEKILSAAK